MASVLVAPADPIDPEVAARRQALLLDDVQIQQIEKEAAPAGELLAERQKVANLDIVETERALSAADTALRMFLNAAALKNVLAEEAPTSGNDVPAPEVSPDPQRTHITSDGGTYFDPPSGLLLFLKNIVVRDPRIDLTATEELKVFFKPKETDQPADEGGEPHNKKEDSLISGAKFGNPSRIVATGVVVLDYKPANPNDPKVKASARTVIY